MLSRNFPSWVVACWGYFAVLVCAWGQDSFLLREPRLRPDGGFEIRFQPLLNHYFVLRRSSDLAGIARPVAATLGGDSERVLVDPDGSAAAQRFYRVEAISYAAPQDLDRDRLNDLFELLHSAAFIPLSSTMPLVISMRMDSTTFRNSLRALTRPTRTIVRWRR